MGSTKEKIANMALGHCGVTGSIASLASDKSAEAVNCNTFYDAALEETLEDFPWAEFSSFAALGLVTQNPNDDWDCAYRYPSDCVFVRKVVSGAGRQDPTPPPFEIGQDDQGKLIYTDQPDAVIKYTKRIVDAGRFSSNFAMALSWKLAMLIAPMTGRVKGITDKTEAGYLAAIAKARVKAANEHQADPEQDAGHIQARN